MDGPDAELHIVHEKPLLCHQQKNESTTSILSWQNEQENQQIGGAKWNAMLLIAQSHLRPGFYQLLNN